MDADRDEAHFIFLQKNVLLEHMHYYGEEWQSAGKYAATVC